MCRFEGKSILGLRGTDSSGTGLDGAEFFCSPDLCGEQKLPLPGDFPADRKPCTDNVSVAAYLRDSCSRFLFQQSESGIHREEGVQKSCSCDFPYGDAVPSGAGCLVFFRLLAFYTGWVRCPDMAGKIRGKETALQTAGRNFDLLDFAVPSDAGISAVWRYSDRGNSGGASLQGKAGKNKAAPSFSYPVRSTSGNWGRNRDCSSFRGKASQCGVFHGKPFCLVFYSFGFLRVAGGGIGGTGGICAGNYLLPG